MSARNETVAVIGATGLILAGYHYFYDSWQLWPRLPGSFGLLLAGDVLPLLLAPLLVIRFVLREALADYGWRFRLGGRDFAAAALALLCLTPLGVWLASTPQFTAAYPSPAFPPAREHGIGLLLFWALHLAPQLLAVECFFRGYLFFPATRRFGLAGSVAVGAFYVALHFHPSKPPAELILAAVAAVALSVLAWRTRSFVPPFLAHFALAVAIDALGFARLHGLL